LVLAEQDKSQTIKLISYLLQRLSKLYQLTNWTEDNAVFLAEWIYDNYKFDSLDDIITCLKNPPHTEHKQWRLTPDTIQEWMSIILTKRAEQREIENEKMKEGFRDKIEQIDYDAFKKKIETEGLPNDKKREVDSEYENFKMNYLMEKRKTQTSTGSLENEEPK
jgi:hypothetical protein